MGGCFGEVGVFLVWVCFGVEGCCGPLGGGLEVGGSGGHGERSSGQDSTRGFSLESSYVRNWVLCLMWYVCRIALEDVSSVCT